MNRSSFLKTLLTSIAAPKILTEVATAAQITTIPTPVYVNSLRIRKDWVICMDILESYKDTPKYGYVYTEKI